MTSEQKDARVFPPSDKKIQDARLRGEVVSVNELRSSFVFFFVSLALLIFSKLISLMSLEILSSPLSASAIYSSNFSDMKHLDKPILLLVYLLLCIVAASVFACISCFFVSYFPRPHSVRICPKMANINPLSVVRQKFSGIGIWGYLLSILKVLMAGAIFFFLAQKYILFDMLANNSGDQVFIFLIDRVFDFLIVFSIGLLVLGVVDYIVQRHAYFERLRMTREELREEQRELDGRPEIRQRRMQRAKEIVEFGGREAVLNADLVLVNPTHIAIALYWDKRGKSVPIVTAKGRGRVAAMIRSIAEEAGVPVLRDVATARSLYECCAVGGPIERRHFLAVAAAFRFVSALEGVEIASTP